MKKISLFFVSLVAVLSLILPTGGVKAADPIVDKEFLPGFNAYGRDNSVFISSCTRFVPANAAYTSYFDLAVKNDQGAGYPMKASIRTAVSPTIPSETPLKSYTQSTFNNYAMSGNLLSRFTANDSQGLTLTVGSNYFVCIDDLANNNATGWFYTSSASGWYSIQGYPGDVQNTFSGSFGYRTYYTPAAAETTDTTGTTGTGTTGTSSSAIKSGSGPSSNISSAIAKPTGLKASHDSANKAVVISWTASATTTIGGYNVYRSDVTGKDYKKIGDTGKTTVIFNDTNVVAGKTYYYVVRAYKDTAESASSDEATALVPVGAAVADTNVTTTSATEVVNTPWYKNPIIWSLVAVAILAALLLILIVMRRRKSAKKNTPEVQ